MVVMFKPVVIARPSVIALMILEPLMMVEPEVMALVILELLVRPLVVVVMAGLVLIVVLATYGPEQIKLPN